MHPTGAHAVGAGIIGVAMRNMVFVLWIIGAAFLLCGCDPVTTHKITSTIFDGVPSLPPAEQYCREYHDRALKEEAEAARKKKEQEALGQASIHPPYEEKRCAGCHDKNTDTGFVKPKNELCFVCHKDFGKGAFVHGPVAVGACLECHLPHNSPNASLLKKTNGQVCETCHREQRLTQGMHAAVAAKGITCTVCHNPHAGNVRFFLK